MHACGAREALHEYEADGDSKFVPFRLPLVDILHKRRERVVLERFLEVPVLL